jgi:hypothetical protein|tara:strand:+ start:305 stop:652 length:348 start_codon:yes stop_codon:yes gene_type:complete
MEDLPNDMVDEILRHITSDRDIVNCSLVSRDFKKHMDIRRSSALLNMHIASHFDMVYDYSQNLQEFLRFCSEFFEYPRRPVHRNMGKRYRRNAMKLWWASHRGSRTVDALLPTMW